MNKAHALLPPAWRGRSRAAAWRRARARRVVSAGMLLVAGLVAWSAFQQPTAASRTIVVAARDLPAGHQVTPTDLRTRPWPAGASLPGGLSAAVAQGAVTTSAIAAGEPLTASRVRAGRRWPGVRTGDVVVAVPAPDPSITRLLRPGDRIDVLGADAAVGSDLPVLMITPADTSRAGGSPGAVWVSAPGAVAARMAAQTASSRTAGTQLSILIRPSA